MNQFQQTTKIIGVVGLAICIIKIRDYLKRIQQFQQQETELQKIYLQSLKPSKLEQIKTNTSKSELVLLYGIIPKLNEATFYWKQKQLSKYNPNFIFQSYLEHATGGQFSFELDKNSFECDIKDSIISTSILNKARQPVKIFHNSQLKPIVYNLNATIKQWATLTIYGQIGYNLTQNKFIIQPKFIGKNFNEILQYWKNKKYKYKSYIFLLIILGLCFGYMGLNKFIRKCVNWIKDKFFPDNQLGDNQHFQKIKKFQTKQQYQLKCGICKNNLINMVFDCAHMTVCQQCYSSGQIKCLICGKIAKRSLKIFQV